MLKARVREPVPMLLFSIGLSLVKNIQEEQIACHGRWWRKTRIVEHLPDNIDDTNGIDDLTDILE